MHKKKKKKKCINPELDYLGLVNSDDSNSENNNSRMKLYE